MALETRKEVIDGRNITVVQLPGRRALKLKVKLIKLLGPSFANLVGKLKKKGSALDTDIAPSDIAHAMEGLSMVLDPDKYLLLMYDILASTRVQDEDSDALLEANTDAAFDILFAGHQLFLYKVVWFTLRTNYPDFFGEGGIGLLSNLMEENRPVEE